MNLSRLAKASSAVAATRSRRAKVRLLAQCLLELPTPDIACGASYLTGELPQGRIGLGPSIVRAVRSEPASRTELTVSQTHAALQDIANTRGAGARDRRRRLLASLLSAADDPTQDFLRRLILGELRQGALSGLMTEAIAEAAGQPIAAVRKAVMFSGDLPRVAEQAILAGGTGLARFGFELFRPLQAMLAQPADSPGAALSRLGEASLEYKLDGARVQIHKLDDEVRVFSRQLNEVTASVPEIVERVRSLPAGSLVLDGEVLALDGHGRPLPFQVTMQRFGRRQNVAEMRQRLPLTAVFFDCLYREGEDLIESAARDRRGVLQQLLPADALVPGICTGREDEADAFLDRALAAGHEGIMAKSPLSAYQAGARGADWLKIKPVQTLDLVVLAAEWGSGRREGRLSNLHLGARDPASNAFAMLGKTFKGLTDAMLDWQTQELLQREIGREGQVVHVRPELVVEIAYRDLQRSSQYPCGMALRFARVKRYRSDKTAAQADTLQAVRGLFEERLQGGRS